MERALEAYRDAARGDLRRALAAISALASSSSDSERAYALALRSLFDEMVHDVVAPPAADELRALVDASTEAPLVLALHHRMVDAFVAFDPVSMVVWAELARDFHASRGGELFGVVAELGALGASVLAGSSAPSVDAEGVREASRACDPCIGLHHQALSALAALRGDALDDALTLARRASRMAASEGLLEGEYFANVTLARVRRRYGRGHLAVRILTSLGAVVPPPWQLWVGIERAVAGATDGTPLAPSIDALARGERSAFRASALDVSRRAEGFAPLAEELEMLVEMIDPEAEPSERVRAWVHGERDPTPAGIRDPARAMLAVAVVVAAPSRRARRVLTAGTGLVPADALHLEASASALRTHHALARIALAGDAGIEPAELFARVYGFAMADPTHEEVFRGLLHRVRAALGDAAEVRRDGTRIRLSPHRTVVVPDPRCEVALSDRILTCLAGMGGRATARAIADALQIPLRTVQRTLGELVDDGACAAEPDGRRVEYVVEDTTFHEPTLHRLRGRRA